MPTSAPTFQPPLRLPTLSHPSIQCLPRRQSASPTAPTMLRVQKGRRPDNWNSSRSKLSGRFLPLDPRDENILDLLVGDTHPNVSLEDVYAAEGPTSQPFNGDTTDVQKWSRRSEAARKRWADPVYRAKVLEKRAEKKKQNASRAKLNIGPVDSITLCNDDKAKAINDYARSNKLRSEKITAFHRNRKQWMENRLRDSPMKLSDEEYVNMKILRKERRRLLALQREERMRAAKAGGRESTDGCTSPKQPD